METAIKYYQVIMLTLLYLTLTARSIMLYLKDGINPFVLGKGKKGFDTFLELLFIAGLLTWSYEIIAIIFNVDFHLIPIKPAYEIIYKNSLLDISGALLIIIGYVLFLLSLIAFGNSWRVGIDNSNPGKLATRGIYSITRNPIFLFMDLYFIGTALINMNMIFIGFAILTIPGIHYQILQEEKFLQKHYGSEYSEYKRSVRRYI